MPTKIKLSCLMKKKVIIIYLIKPSFEGYKKVINPKIITFTSNSIYLAPGARPAFDSLISPILGQ